MYMATVLIWLVTPTVSLSMEAERLLRLAAWSSSSSSCLSLFFRWPETGDRWATASGTCPLYTMSMGVCGRPDRYANGWAVNWAETGSDAYGTSVWRGTASDASPVDDTAALPLAWTLQMYSRHNSIEQQIQHNRIEKKTRNLKIKPNLKYIYKYYNAL